MWAPPSSIDSHRSRSGLQREGPRPIGARGSNGPQGRFRIVITDWMMPGPPGGSTSCAAGFAPGQPAPARVRFLLLSQRSMSSGRRHRVWTRAPMTYLVKQSPGRAHGQSATPSASLAHHPRTSPVNDLSRAPSPSPNRAIRKPAPNRNAVAPILPGVLAPRGAADTPPASSPEIDDEFLRLLFLTRPLHEIGRWAFPRRTHPPQDRQSHRRRVRGVMKTTPSAPTRSRPPSALTPSTTSRWPATSPYSHERYGRQAIDGAQGRRLLGRSMFALQTGTRPSRRRRGLSTRAATATMLSRS